MPTTFLSTSPVRSVQMVPAIFCPPADRVTVSMRSRSWGPPAKVVGSNRPAVISSSTTSTPASAGNSIFSVRRWPGCSGLRRRLCSPANGPRKSGDQAIDVCCGVVAPGPSVSIWSRSPRTWPVTRIGLGPARVSHSKLRSCPAGVSRLITRTSILATCPPRLKERWFSLSVRTTFRSDPTLRIVVWTYPTGFPCMRQMSQVSNGAAGFAAAAAPAAVVSGPSAADSTRESVVQLTRIKHINACATARNKHCLARIGWRALPVPSSGTVRGHVLGVAIM